jgi:hypothetical protein
MSDIPSSAGFFLGLCLSLLTALPCRAGVSLDPDAVPRVRYGADRLSAVAGSAVVIVGTIHSAAIQKRNTSPVCNAFGGQLG